MVTSYDATTDQWRCWERAYRFQTKQGVIFPHQAGPFAITGDSVETSKLPHVAYPASGLWGNATSRARAGALATAVQGAGGPCASGPMHLSGQSQFGLACLNIAKYTPAACKSLVSSIPVVDPQDVYDNNRGGFAGAVASAYGGRPADADCPARNAAAFLGIPGRIYYSLDDTVTPASIMEPFAAAAGFELVSMGSIGHAVASPFSGDAVGRFFLAH